MRDGIARGTPTVLPGADSEATQLLQHDAGMRQFTVNPQTTQAGRAELNSLLCVQQTLQVILQTIREQARWPADESCGHDPVVRSCPSTAED